MVRLVLSSEIYKISNFSTCIIMIIYCFAIFQKKSNFLGFYIVNASLLLRETCLFDLFNPHLLKCGLLAIPLRSYSGLV